jgi:hypothetical protein
LHRHYIQNFLLSKKCKKAGYSKVFLYSSKDLMESRKLCIKNGFVDIQPYNNDHRGDVFMIKNL